MSNNHTQAKSTINIDITFNNFDFDLETMKFIGTLFKDVRGSKVEALVDALRWWGAERSGNQSLDVTYQIRAAKMNGITSGTEYVNVALAGEHENEDVVLSVILATGLKADGGMAAIVNKVAPLDALTIYDTRLAAIKSDLGTGPFLAAYVSLRHQIATAARMADHAEVKEHSLTFEIEDGEIVHAFKVVVDHFALTDTAQAELTA